MEIDMKKEKKAFFSLLFVLPILSSCLFFQGSSSSGNPGEDAVFREPDYPSDYRSENLNVTNLGYWNGQVFMPSTGRSSILVLPIEFSDCPFSQVELTRMEKTFFGDSDETSWESVRSYYDKSSYGKLEIDGEVSDVIHFDITAAEVAERAKREGTSELTQDILFSALRVLEDNGMDFSRFDANGDGYLDAVWMVYSASYDEGSDLFWAFTTWAGGGRENDFSGYSASSYSWASVDFLTRNSFSTSTSTTNGDAHTFVHETGHLMGLDDYYSYDADMVENMDSPTGGAVMMDYNIGDHDAYSKFVLDWVDPIVVTEETLKASDYRLTLDSFANYGDCLILPIEKDGKVDYNGTAFDEYLILEYYTPDGVNSLDSRVAYNNLKMFSQSGILVYHVDSRIGKMIPDRLSDMGFKWNGECYDKISDALEDSGNFLFYYIYSNTRSYCLDTSMDDSESPFYRGRLISLLSADGRKTTFESNVTMAGNPSLFQEGDAFFLPEEMFDDFKFDDGSVPRYGFEVESLDGDSCVLHFKEAQ